MIVFSHGGGWALCGLDTHDRTTRRLAQELGAVVISVDYRLAPEARCPAAAEDAYAATVWAEAHYGPRRLVVAGDSAGGNLSAVVALMARDRDGPTIHHQLLVYPVTDAAMDSASYTENATGYFLTRTHMAWYWEQYLGPDGDGEPSATPRPIRADDLSGLPPATVLTAELDPLRDEGEAYAAALGRGRHPHRGPPGRRPVPRLLRPGRAPARGEARRWTGPSPASATPSPEPGPHRESRFRVGSRSMTTVETQVEDLYWDPFDTEIDANPYGIWKRMRDEAPVYRNDRHDFWALSRYEDVEAAHRDPATFSSAHGHRPGDHGPGHGPAEHDDLPRPAGARSVADARLPGLHPPPHRRASSPTSGSSAPSCSTPTWAATASTSSRTSAPSCRPW